MSVRDLLRSRRRHFVIGAVFLVGTNVFANAIPWVLKHAIEAIEASDLAGLATPVLLLVALAAASAVFRVLSRIFVFYGARLIEYDFRNRLFSHLLELPPSWYRDRPTGDLMSRVTNDVSHVRVMFGPGYLNIINTVCAYTMALPLLVIIDLPLTLYTVIPIPVMLLASRNLARSIYRRQGAVQAELAAISSRLHENLAGITVVKSYVLTDRERADFDTRNDAYMDKSMRLVLARGLFMPLVASISGVGMLIVLFSGGHAVSSGRISLGDLVAFMGYLAMLTWPTLALGWVVTSWQRGRAALERLQDVLEEVPAIADPPEPVPLPAPRGALEVRDLTLGHGPGEPVLRNVSLSVPAGGSLGVVGRTATGKSTLVHALLRLVDVPPGAITLDGVDVTRLSLADLRGAFSLVPQDTFLFSSTIRRNLAFGSATPDAPGEQERIRQVARLAALQRDVEGFPDGYETVVGERGITLSGGQKQRAAIARALFVDRPVLVLDDALSSVDSATEHAIVDALRRVARRRTTLVVSHRMSSVAWCDQVVVLDGGRIVERGTHDELVAGGGWYADTWALQQHGEQAGAGAAA